MSLSRQVLAFATCVLCGLFCGCAVTRKSASYDSTSKMPWMGLELAAPRKAPAPETQRIRLEGSIPLEPEPAKLVMLKPRKESARRSLKKETTDVPRPIPIPRTDVSDAPQPALDEGPDVDDAARIEF